MVRHNSVNEETVILPGDEVLVDGQWEKVKLVQGKDIIFEATKVVDIKALIPKWEVLVRVDNSTKEVEFEVAVIKTDNETSDRSSLIPGESKVVLFNEQSNILPTKHNLEHMRSIANSVRDFMNKAKIEFELEECCGNRQGS